MKSIMKKKQEIKQKWYLVDAKNQVLGRMAVKIAARLMGKHRVSYTPHVAGEDEIVVINAGAVSVTGKKMDQKLYHHHSQYPGGLKEEKLSDLMTTNPEKVIRHAVKGMLPKNKLAAVMLKRLKIYKDDKHPHKGQNPEPIKI